MNKEERLAEFVGVMLGDGCIGIYDCKAGNRIKKQYQLKVTLDSRNKEYSDYVYNLIKDILEVEPKPYLKKDENTIDIRVFKKDKILFILNDIGLELSPKWNRAKIPEKFLDKNWGLFVLRGLFDTDGSVTRFNNHGIIYPRLELRLSPSPMQDQVIDILRKNNFNYKIQKLERGKIKIRLSGINELKKWKAMVGSSNELYLNRINSFLKKGL
ncbi:hypothetical protein HYW74_00925 [Candidatus Pacearchaeota archaeon]|nr:hypothetical protein [Candidatus Pacearchaeota archaeon]